MNIYAVFHKRKKKCAYFVRWFEIPPINGKKLDDGNSINRLVAEL